MTTKDFILLGAGYAAGRMSKKMQAGPIGAVKKKYIYPFLLQQKKPGDKKFSTVYGFARSMDFESYIDEYKAFWPKRTIRIIQNPKYKTKVLNIPEKIKKGY